MNYESSGMRLTRPFWKRINSRGVRGAFPAWLYAIDNEWCLLHSNSLQRHHGSLPYIQTDPTRTVGYRDYMTLTETSTHDTEK